MSTITAEPIALSTLEFDVLWEHLGLGRMPLVLKVPSPGRSYGERAALVDDVWRRLTLRGLRGPDGLNPHLERTLRLLANPERAIDGRLWIRLRSVRLLVAASGREAAMAVLADGHLSVREAAASGLAREALSVLPAGPAGPGASVTLPSVDLEVAAADAQSPEEFEHRLLSRGVRAADAAALRVMVTRARRQGQFGASARDHRGRRVRAPRVVSFFDSPKGRYLQLRRSEPGGEPWSTIAPADYRLLAAELTELVDEAVSAAG